MFHDTRKLPGCECFVMNRPKMRIKGKDFTGPSPCGKTIRAVSAAFCAATGFGEDIHAIISYYGKDSVLRR